MDSGEKQRKFYCRCKGDLELVLLLESLRDSKLKAQRSVPNTRFAYGRRATPG